MINLPIERIWKPEMGHAVGHLNDGVLSGRLAGAMRENIANHPISPKLHSTNLTFGDTIICQKEQACRTFRKEVCLPTWELLSNRQRVCLQGLR
ncbi:hypothetical protein ACOJBO_03585 [Rhizobium beringeri]